MKNKKPSKATAWHPCFFFLSLCLSEREPFIACSVAADKADPLLFVEVTVRARLGEHLPKHSPTIDLHYPAPLAK